MPYALVWTKQYDGIITLDSHQSYTMPNGLHEKVLYVRTSKKKTIHDLSSWKMISKSKRLFSGIIANKLFGK